MEKGICNRIYLRCNEHCSDPNHLQLGLGRFDHQALTLKVPDRITSVSVYLTFSLFQVPPGEPYLRPVNKVDGHVEGLLQKAELNVYLLMHVTGNKNLNNGKIDKMRLYRVIFLTGPP